MTRAILLFLALSGGMLACSGEHISNVDSAVTLSAVPIRSYRLSGGTLSVTLPSSVSAEDVFLAPVATNTDDTIARLTLSALSEVSLGDESQTVEIPLAQAGQIASEKSFILTNTVYE